MKVRRTQIIITALFVAGVAAAPSSAQTAEDLFAAGSLQEVRLLMNSRDLALLHARFEENTYYPADLIWRGIRMRNVGVRSRGGASRNAMKPGLHIDIDRYTTGQRFLGLHALVLDNLALDAGMVRELVAMAFISRMGQPAPRESLARLYVNNTYYGAYAIVEDIDTVFLARALGDDSGYLYENHLIDPPYNFEDLGDDLTRYKAIFEARTRQFESDGVVYGPIRELARDINDPDEAAWRTRIETRVDLRQFVTMVATEAFLAEQDGLLGLWGMHNFYLYRPATSGVHRFIAWDKDAVFEGAHIDVFRGADQNALFRRGILYDDLRAVFLDALEACAHAASEDGWLEDQIRRSAAVIDAAAHEDTRKPFSNAEYEAAVEFFIAFAQQRPASVLAQVAAARGTP